MNHTEQTIASLWKQGAARLQQAGVETPDLDAELLLRQALGLSRASFFAHLSDMVAEKTSREYDDLISRRAGHEPIQYITGRQEFMGLDFRVNPAVLVPRPDTEILVEHVMEKLSRSGEAAQPGQLRIADIGTGSGAIAVSLAKLIPCARVVAIDISPQALATARSNAEHNGISDRVRFLQGDLLSPLADAGLLGGLDAIVSNPPYIPSPEIATLALHVQQEPHLALDGGNDGLVFYRRLVHEAAPYLTPGGLLALEVGYGQAQDVRLMLEKEGYTEIEIHKDLAGIERVVSGRLRRPV